MSEEAFGSTPPGPESSQEPAASEASWGAPQPQTPPPPSGYAAPPPGYAPPPPPPGYAAQPVAAQGLNENTACALAYVTFIPAIIFLLMPPYNQSAKIKFHAIQMLALSVIGFVVMVVVSFLVFIPILGFLIYLATGIALLAVWILCIYKASQGTAFKLPVIGDFAAKQSGFAI
jgi:uncharacterized membrane protein